MPKIKKVTLLDRAKSDLKTAKLILQQVESDEILIDVCAYHCQQCVEKIAKYAINMQGDDYVPDHRVESYIADLHDGEMKQLIESITIDINAWATFIRYRNTILASKREVIQIIEICERLVVLSDNIPLVPGADTSVADAVDKLASHG
jgi:HEPN domain-containing protein